MYAMSKLRQQGLKIFAVTDLKNRPESEAFWWQLLRWYGFTIRQLQDQTSDKDVNRLVLRMEANRVPCEVRTEFIYRYASLKDGDTFWEMRR
jgi:hypothetical protein